MVKTKNIFYSLITLILITILAKLIFLSEITNSVSSTLLYPFLFLQHKIVRPINNIIYNFKSNSELQAVVDFYRKDNEALQAQLIEFQALRNYAKSVKELSNYLKRYRTEKAILSQVILKNIDEQSHFIYLDSGTVKGVKKDMVVVYKNCLIGRISQVYPYYSKAILITDSSCKVAAYCATNNTPGIHAGKNIDNITDLAFVNHLKEVYPRDLVISSGEGTVFPRGFGLGYIDKVENDGFNYNITVKPLVNINSLEYCYIIEKGAEFNS